MNIFKVFFCLSLFNCQSNNTDPITHYSLDQPEKVYQLPEELREISGLTYVNENTLACVQDETGVIYLYNLKSESIDSIIPFGPAGDYEGIEFAEGTFYILKSDGTIIKYANKQSKTINTFLTEESNTEGLCHDKLNNRLLIAGKGKSPGLEKHERGIYSFDLTSETLTENPAYIINKEEIKNNSFAPSAIAVHPMDNTIYIVSSKGALLVLNRKGEVINYENLSRKIFFQPEGICFNKQGDMYLSDEGEKNGSGSIVKFNYIK